MKKLIIIVVLTTLAVGFHGVKLAGQAGNIDKKTKKGAPAAFDRTATLRVLVDSAREAYESCEAEYEAGTTAMDNLYIWSNRWRAATVKAADNKDKAMQANTDHLDRMKRLHKMVKALYDAQAKGGEENKFRASKFYVAEAELLVAEPVAISVAIRGN